MKLFKVLVFIIVLGTTSSAFLVGVNQLTASRIAKNEELKLKSSVMDVLEIPYKTDDAINTFGKVVKESKIGGYTFYISSDGSLAFEFNGPGLWGPIAAIISIEKDLTTIRKIKITHQEETPGLGGRIAEAGFLKQFKNKEIFPKIVFTKEGMANGKNEVDAITGATGSSKALEKLINENVSKYLNVFRGEKNA